MDSDEKVSLPLIHKHEMVLWNDLRKGDCCGGFEASSDGYYCERCDFFAHKKCGDEASESIQHPSHSLHPLQLQNGPNDKYSCDECGKTLMDLFYYCETCDLGVDLHCAKYPPPKVIENSEKHHHKLTLFDYFNVFECEAKCGKPNGYHQVPYKCNECDLAFHVDCVYNQLEVDRPLEVNHSYHPLHPLKLLTGQPPEYSDGKCRLCGRNADRKFYHCSSCNFTLDMRCVLHPPPQSVMDSKVHEHQLSLLPRHISFTCNACGLKGDRSPYVCVQCDFVIHKDCFGLPRVININRHEHRVSHIPLIGVVNSVCRVCRKKVDWTCGGYSCQKCVGYVVHSKCAIRKDVWNGKELEGVPEEVEDLEPYVVIDENTIQHFSHKEHYLRVHFNGVMYEENKRCRACSHPVGLQSFYGCMDCDYILHRNCAELPRRKWHAIHNDRLTLVTNEADSFLCDACGTLFSGFIYRHGSKNLDVRCSSISEPFFHPSHHHPLYDLLYHIKEICYGCHIWEWNMLSCVEDDCKFFLGYKCATLPQVVKHRVDDHLLSLCYGERKTSGKYWCDICEKETNPTEWFYTCKDHRASLHIPCVLGEHPGLMPESITKVSDESFELVMNDSVSCPICSWCKSHCIYPVMWKLLGTSDTYYCHLRCVLQMMEKKESL